LVIFLAELYMALELAVRGHLATSSCSYLRAFVFLTTAMLFWGQLIEQRGVHVRLSFEANPLPHHSGWG
jgi:hypothetical protein